MLAALSAQAQVTVNVDADNPGKAVSPNLYGIFFEDINHAADGGLYAELISNRSFEDGKGDEIPTWTMKAHKGVSYKLTTKGLLNSAQGKALQMKFKASADSPVILSNEGFWGINAVKGRHYRLAFFIKGKYKGRVTARLVSADGKSVIAETPVTGKVYGRWNKWNANLTAKGNDPKAQFQLLFDGKSSVTLDVVSLFPPTFNNVQTDCAPS